MTGRLTPRERWDGRYAVGPGTSSPSPFLQEVAHLLPTEGYAVDIAGGSGRNAVWLAQHGLDTTLLDVSPVGLTHGAAAAEAAGVALELIEHDLEAHGLPELWWDVLLIHLFLDWDVMNQVPQRLNNGGIFVFMQPTATNLERHPSPSRRFLLGDGQLERWVIEQDLHVLFHTEDWVESTGRHESRLVAQREL